jgi:Tfp pilus assembly protein PilX
MYDPVGIPRRLTRRGVKVALVFLAMLLVAIVVTVVRTMPHPQQEDPLTLDQIQLMLIPDAAQTALVAAQVKARLAQANATPSAAAAAASCVASNPPNTWDGTQRANATTIYQVGVALSVPTRGEIVAVATAIQESQLYNLGDLGPRNDHDSLGLFQQRPSMGWGSPSQVMDPVYSATAFYLALKRVPGWESMAVTVAAQRVQRSAFPSAYAKWEKDATSLVQKASCSAPLAG